VNRIRRTLSRTIRAAKALATDIRVPRWLRWLFVFGLLPIPVIPVDEAALVLALGILAVFYRGLVAEAWESTSV